MKITIQSETNEDVKNAQRVIAEKKRTLNSLIKKDLNHLKETELRRYIQSFYELSSHALKMHDHDTVEFLLEQPSFISHPFFSEGMLDADPLYESVCFQMSDYLSHHKPFLRTFMHSSNMRAFVLTQQKVKQLDHVEIFNLLDRGHYFHFNIHTPPIPIKHHHDDPFELFNLNTDSSDLRIKCDEPSIKAPLEKTPNHQLSKSPSVSSGETFLSLRLQKKKVTLDSSLLYDMYRNQSSSEALINERWAELSDDPLLWLSIEFIERFNKSHPFEPFYFMGFPPICVHWVLTSNSQFPILEKDFDLNIELSSVQREFLNRFLQSRAHSTQSVFIQKLKSLKSLSGFRALLMKYILDAIKNDNQYRVKIKPVLMILSYTYRAVIVSMTVDSTSRLIFDKRIKPQITTIDQLREFFSFVFGAHLFTASVQDALPGPIAYHICDFYTDGKNPFNDFMSWLYFECYLSSPDRIDLPFYIWDVLSKFLKSPLPIPPDISFFIIKKEYHCPDFTQEQLFELFHSISLVEFKNPINIYQKIEELLKRCSLITRKDIKECFLSITGTSKISSFVISFIDRNTPDLHKVSTHNTDSRLLKGSLFSECSQSEKKIKIEELPLIFSMRGSMKQSITTSNKRKLSDR